MSAYVEWEMEGWEFVNCNCSWGCPCQFNALPTSGNCRGGGFVRVDKGHFGDVPLAGLCWGAVFAWPNAVHLGNGRMQTIVDERANQAQRAALEAVAQGRETEPGSLIWQVFSTTMSEVLPTLYKRIELSIDPVARTAQVRVPGFFESHGESIRNPVTNTPHPVHVTMPTGFEFTESEVLNGWTKSAGDIQLDLAGSHAHIAQIHWSTHGVKR